MSMLYSTAIHLLYMLVLGASPFNKKAWLWISGRRNWRTKLMQWQHSGSPTLWFHAASLGEFEQGLPLIEELRNQIPGCSVVLTFYSPSGYEIRKNYEKADQVFYLPLDTRYNARAFLNLVKPDAAFFIKYEFWYFYLKQLQCEGIPTFLVSGMFMKKQIFFRWYGSWFRKKLACFTHFFLQDAVSSDLLNSIGLHNVTTTGDTRCDRVTATAATAKNIEIAGVFSSNGICIVAGSTWPADEESLTRFINESGTHIKYIIAPHEIDDPHIKRLSAQIRKSQILYSVSNVNNVADKQVLIIDNIGMLASLYSYGQLAYIGGGFGKGIHNILEAAVFGIPVIFGPNYSKFHEAGEMIESGGAFTVNSFGELKETLNHLINNTADRLHSSMQAREYVKINTGATKIVTQQVIKTLGPD
jgi:3-deoxy-D-manno-octulosonic-acid transferase